MQRLEANGAGSLRTRRSVAAALGVEPSTLDAAATVRAGDGEAGPAASPLERADSSGASRQAHSGGGSGQAHSGGGSRHAHSSGGSFLVGLYALAAVLLFGFVVLDQVYARLIVGRIPGGDRTALFSEVADFLLEFTALAALIAFGAIAAAWHNERARWLLVASVASGVVLPIALAFAINALVPGALTTVDGNVSGPILRFAVYALSAVFAVCGFGAHVRTTTRHGLRGSAARGP